MPFSPISPLPIGTVRSTRSAVVDDQWDSVASFIELDARFASDALAGLEAFSHVEIVFWMDSSPGYTSSDLAARCASRLGSTS